MVKSSKITYSQGWKETLRYALNILQILLPSIFIAVLVVFIFIKAYTPSADVFKYLGYHALYIIVPGVLVYLAFSARPVSFSRLLAMGWAAGFALETLFYYACAALNIRQYFVAYPALVMAPAALVCLMRLLRKNEIHPADATPKTDVSKIMAIGLFSLMLVALAMYLYVGMFLTQPLPGTFGLATLNENVLWHIGMMAEASNRFPLNDPQLAGAAAQHVSAAVYHLAATKQITNIPAAEIVQRLNPMLSAIALAFLLYTAGKSLDGKRATGLLSAFLFLFVGEVALPGITNGEPRFESLWSNPSYVMALIFFAALLVEFIRARTRAPNWPMIILLGTACAVCDPQPIFLLCLGSAIALLATYARARHIDRTLFVWFALSLSALVLVALSDGLGIVIQSPAILLTAALLQSIGAGWIVWRAKRFDEVILALAILFFIGMVVLLSAPNTFLARNFALMAGSVVAAHSLQLLLLPAQNPSTKRVALAGCSLLTGFGFALTPVAFLIPPLKNIAEGELAYTKTFPGLSSPLYAGLQWLNAHSFKDEVFATNRVDKRDTGGDAMYSAFSERNVLLGFASSDNPSNLAQRQALTKAVFEDGSGEALKQMRDAYGVRYLFVDLFHGPPLPLNLYSIVSPLYTNEDATIYAINISDKYPLPQSISAQGGRPFIFKSEVVIDELDMLTSMEFTNDGRLFIGEKSGIIKVYQKGQLLPEPFVDLSEDVNNTYDRGLLGFALDPNFPANPYVYVFYVYDPPGVKPDGLGARVSRVERIKADPQNTSRAATTPDARTILMGKNSILENIGNTEDTFDQTKQSCYAEATGYKQDCLGEDSLTHAGGGVVFAKDGSLWISIGEGGLAGTDMRAVRAQSLDSLSGKIVRINPQTGEGYPDNPFFDGNKNSNRSKIISYGLRNPYRFLLHPDTQELYIGDVGQVTWEEINMGKGKNFGWPCYEGDNDQSAHMTAFEETSNANVRAVCDPLYAANNSTVTAPIYSYKHLRSESIIMGVVYTGTQYPAFLQGALIFADYNWDKISYMRIQDGEHGKIHPLLFDTPDTATSGPSHFTQSPDGYIWYTVYSGDLGKSQVRRILYTNLP